MLGAYEQQVESQLREIRAAGLWKPERVLDSPQRPEARLHGGQDVVVLCANNYLGLADDPRVVAPTGGIEASRGFGSCQLDCGVRRAQQRKRPARGGVQDRDLGECAA